MIADHAAVRQQVLDHLLQDPFNLETDSLEQSAGLISQDIGLPALAVLAILREFAANGQIQDRAGGYVVFATPPRKRAAKKVVAKKAVPRANRATTGEPNAASPPTSKGRSDNRR